MSRAKFSTPVWILQGLFKSTPGTLELAQERLRLFSDEGTIFDVPLGSLSKVNFPWYFFSVGANLSVESKRYRLSFAEPGENGNLVEGHAAGKRWKVKLSKK
jgi:hypothetical protein